MIEHCRYLYPSVYGLRDWQTLNCVRLHRRRGLIARLSRVLLAANGPFA